MMKKTTTLKRFLLLVLASGLLMAMPLTVFASEGSGNAAVQEARSAIVHFEVIFTDESDDSYYLQSGSGFLINDQYFVTCGHLTQISEEILELYTEVMGIDEDTVKNNLSVGVNTANGGTVKAEVVIYNESEDYAVLKLESAISGHKAAPIRLSGDITPPEDCYTLGFTDIITYGQEEITYTSKDVVLNSGKVENFATVDGIEYILSSAQVNSGYSGSALVDENGNVIGIINATNVPDGLGEASSYAITTDHLCDALNSNGISFTSAAGASEGSSPDNNNPSDPTETPSEMSLPGQINSMPGSGLFFN